MSSLKCPIDYKSLEEELLKGLEADQIYKLQNDAKIRAVEQNVPTYEHFRQMVNGAHLRPLERTDIRTQPPSSWNPISNLKEVTFSSAESLKSSQPESNPSRSNSTVGTKQSMNFLKFWDNTIDSKEKFQFLWENRHNMQEAFRVEVPTFFVGQSVHVCLESLDATEDVNAIIDILTLLSNCNRFYVAVSFLREQEKGICLELFQKLLLIAKSQDEILENVVRALAVKYYVVLD